MVGFFWGLVAAVLVALILAIGGSGPIPTLSVALVVLVVVAVVATVIGRARRPRPQFRLLDPETVPWRIINGTRMSWCRFEVVNDGAPGIVAVQLDSVRPFLQINGMGHLLRGMGRPTAEDGSVNLQTGQRQKFDLFWMGKRAGKQFNVPRDVRVLGQVVAARLVRTELESILDRIRRLRIDPILTEDYLLPTTEWTNHRAELAQNTASFHDAVSAYREVGRVNDQWRWRKEGAKGRIAANLDRDGLADLEKAATGAIAALNTLIAALRRDVTPPGPRRLFMYGICLKDGGSDLEPVNPEHRRYEFDVTAVAGRSMPLSRFASVLTPVPKPSPR